jgi:hypothetical protein
MHFPFDWCMGFPKRQTYDLQHPDCILERQLHWQKISAGIGSPRTLLFHRLFKKNHLGGLLSMGLSSCSDWVMAQRVASQTIRIHKG